MGAKTVNTSSTSNNQTSPDPSAYSAYLAALQKGQATASTPYQPYGGQLVSPTNQLQKAAAGTTGDVNQALNGINNSLGTNNNAVQAAEQDYGNLWRGALGTAQGYAGQVGSLASPSLGSATSIGNTVGGLSNVYQPYYNQAAALTGQGGSMLAPGNFASTVQNYMSPYVQDVVNATQGQFNNQNTQQGQSLLSQGIASGNAFGGDRAGVAEGVLAGQQQTAEAPVIAGLYNTGYQNAANEANTAASTALQAGAQYGSLGTGAEAAALAAPTTEAGILNQGYTTAGNLGASAANIANAGYGTANNSLAGYLQGTQVSNQDAALQQANEQLRLGTTAQQYGMGTQQQTTAQAADTAAYGQFQNSIAFPYEQTGWLGGLDATVGPQMGGTNVGSGTGTVPYGNIGSTIAGGATALTGLAGLLKRGGRVDGFASGGAPSFGTVPANFPGGDATWLIPPPINSGKAFSVPNYQQPNTAAMMNNLGQQQTQSNNQLSSAMTGLSNSSLGDSISDFTQDNLGGLKRGGRIPHYDDGGAATGVGGGNAGAGGNNYQTPPAPLTVGNLPPGMTTAQFSSMLQNMMTNAPGVGGAMGAGSLGGSPSGAVPGTLGAPIPMTSIQVAKRGGAIGHYDDGGDVGSPLPPPNNYDAGWSNPPLAPVDDDIPTIAPNLGQSTIAAQYANQMPYPNVAAQSTNLAYAGSNMPAPNVAMEGMAQQYSNGTPNPNQMIQSAVNNAPAIAVAQADMTPTNGSLGTYVPPANDNSGMPFPQQATGTFGAPISMPSDYSNVSNLGSMPGTVDPKLLASGATPEPLQAFALNNPSPALAPSYIPPSNPGSIASPASYPGAGGRSMYSGPVSLASRGTTPIVNGSAGQPMPTQAAANSPAMTIYDGLIQRGVKPTVAAGAVGSLMGESSKNLNPTAINPNDAGPGLDSAGIGQWNRERLNGPSGLFAFAGLDPNSPSSAIKNVPASTQAAFTLHELDTTHSGALAALQKGASVADGATAWTSDFEGAKPETAHLDQRIQNGQQFYAFTNGHGPSLGTSPASTAINDASPSGNLGDTPSSPQAIAQTASTAPDTGGLLGGLGIHLSKDASLALMSAGFGMMASHSPFMGQGIGEGAQQGVKTYMAAQQLERQNALAAAQIGQAQANTAAIPARVAIEKQNADTQAKQLQRAIEMNAAQINRNNAEALKADVVMTPNGPIHLSTGKPVMPAATEAATVASATGPTPQASTGTQSYSYKIPLPSGLTIDPQLYTEQGHANIAEINKEQVPAALAGAQVAQTQKILLGQLEDDYEKIPANGLLESGADSALRTSIANHATMLAKLLGLDPNSIGIDQQALGSAQGINKIITQLGVSVNKGLGREPGYILDKLTAATPGMENTDEGRRTILAGLKSISQRDQDWNSFLSDYMDKTGASARGAQAAFNQAMPADRYVAEAQMLKKIPKSSIDTLRSDPSKAPIFEKHYGAGMARYFIQ